MKLLKHHFPLIVSLFVSFSLNAQTADSLINQLGRKWINAKEYVLHLAESMSEEHYNYKPVPEIMSFKQQLLHIADNMQWLSSDYLLAQRVSKPDTAHMGKAAIIKYMSQAYDMALQAHFNLTNENANDVVSFFAGSMSRRQILIIMHDHQTHHLGQLVLYLRLKGVKPPDYVGW